MTRNTRLPNRDGNWFYTPILMFFALTFAWSWTCWLLSALIKAQSSLLAVVLMFLGSVGPSIAAFILVTHNGGRASLRIWLARCLQWRLGSGWLALAFFLPLVLMALAAAVHIALGGIIAPSPAIGYVLMVLANFFLVFLVGGRLAKSSAGVALDCRFCRITTTGAWPASF